MRVLTVKSKKLFLVVKIVVYGLKIIGLAPFRLPIKYSIQITTCNTRLQVFQSSKIGLVYNIVLLIPVLLTAVFELPLLFGDDDEKSTVSKEVTRGIKLVEIVLRIFTACIIVIFWGIRQNNAASIMNRLLEIDLGLSHFEKPPFNMRTLIFLNIHIILNACLWTYLLYIELIDYINFLLYLFFVLSFLPNCVIYWFILEYATAVGLVANDIETVNKYLLNFKEFGNYISPPLFPNGRLAIIPRNCNNQELTYRKLNKYREIRVRLVELCEGIGDFFSLPILCCMACCFVTLFHKFYQLFRWANVATSQAEAAPETLLVVLMFAYPVVSLALNVTRVERELFWQTIDGTLQAQLTKRIIDKLLEVTTRGVIKSQLELFSSQLLHEIVSFTAYGFFSLDSSFLLSLMAGTVTYFVALTQFPTDVEDNCSESTYTEQPIITNRSES